MRLPLVTLFALVLTSACTVKVDAAGKACDDQHPCADGRVCVGGVCVAPDSTGDDAGPGDEDAGTSACLVDPLLGTACGAGIGECAQMGLYVCEGSALVCSVTGGVGVAEQCDGKDNDCDGATDEELTPPACEKTLGVCAGAAAPTCGGASGFSACQYGTDFEETETRCDGKDNDCDGVIDDVSGCLYSFLGSGPAGFQDGAAADAKFAFPAYLHFDSAGILYVADRANHALRKIDTNGNVTTIAGTGTCGFEDGPVATAKLCRPTDIEVDANGVVFFTDTSNHRIRKVENGIVSTVAGNGFTGKIDGAAATSEFEHPQGLLLLPDGDLIIADSDNHAIRRYDAATQSVSTVAGTGSGGHTDGPALSAQLQTPVDVVMDSAGNLYVSETSGDRIRVVPPTGSTFVLAGSTSGSDAYAEAIGTAARFHDPGQMALVESANLLFVTDSDNHRVRRVPLNATTSTSSAFGIGSTGWTNGSSGRLETPIGLALSGMSLYFTDHNHVIRKATLSPTGSVVITDVAGTPTAVRTADGDASTALLSLNGKLSRASDGTIFWVEDENNIVRRLSPDGAVQTIAGDATGFTAGEVTGPLVDSRLDDPRDVVMGPDGRLYVVEEDNHSVRVIDLMAGTMEHFAGSTVGSSGTADGALTSARFNGPRALSFGKDAMGGDVLYVADGWNDSLRAIAFPNGPVTTIATGISNVEDLVADEIGNLYFSDSNMVKRLTTGGTISTLYSSLPTGYILALELDGSDLVAVGGRTVVRLGLSANNVTTLLQLPEGWRDGASAEASGGRFTGIAATPEYYLLSDYYTGRLRRLYK